VRGKLVNELVIDWSARDLGELKRLIDFAIAFVDDSIFQSRNEPEARGC